MIEIKQVNPLEEQVLSLIKELDNYQLSIYPVESNHLDSSEELSLPNVFFVGAYQGEKLIGNWRSKIYSD